MADLTFNTTSGATVKRKMLLLCLNTGSASSPTWSPIGKRVEDSSMEFDWGSETKNDILGNTYTTLKEPTIKQTFDPCVTGTWQRWNPWICWWCICTPERRARRYSRSGTRPAPYARPVSAAVRPSECRST